MVAMTPWVFSVSGGRPHSLVWRVKPGDGISVMVAPGKNHLKQKRSVSMALFLTQNLFVVNGGAKTEENWRFEIPLAAARTSRVCDRGLTSYPGPSFCNCCLR